MDYDSDFERFWQAYPVKKSKQQAYKYWLNIKKKKHLPEISVLLKAIKDQQSERSFLNNKKQFVPSWKYPGTWLNGYCWMDNIITEDNTVSYHNKKADNTINNTDKLPYAYNYLLKTNNIKLFLLYCDTIGLDDTERKMVLNKYNGNTGDINNLTRGMFKE